MNENKNSIQKVNTTEMQDRLYNIKQKIETSKYIQQSKKEKEQKRKQLYEKNKEFYKKKKQANKIEKYKEVQMNLIDIIPIGKENKITRQQLMQRAKIFDVNQFKKKLTNLREQYIIVFDDGYYLPSSKEEYEEFINKMKEQAKDVGKIIELAYQEMEELS